MIEAGAVEWPAAKTESEGALAGLHVLDLTRILSGPFATMSLADLARIHQ